MLAPSAFLASAASTFQLQQSILPDSISSLEDGSLESIEALWASQSNSAKPAAEVQHIQKAWDGPVAANHRALLLARAVSEMDTARLLAASSPHSGDWLHAPPITAVGLRLSDEAIRVAVAHRLGCKACEPHTCVCGKPVDARGLHGPALSRAPRQQCYSRMNDITWRPIEWAQVPALEDNKCPDETILLPWAKGKPLALDITVPHTYAVTRRWTVSTPGAAAHQAAQHKITKLLVSQSCKTSFRPRSFRSSGPTPWNDIPAHLHNSDLTLNDFRQLLETTLFRTVLV